MSLAGKSVLITGGSRGLGRAIAQRFVAEGARVSICAREEGLLRATAAELGVLAESADVSRPADVDRVVAAVAERLGGIDVLVCCAGIHGPIGPVEEVDWREWAQAVEVNLFGTVLACRAVLPLMRERGWGKIIAISGGGATQPRPRFSAYAASKAALVRFVETLAAELAGTGIDVNAVAPGPLNTRLLEDILSAGPERVGQEGYARALEQRDTGGAGFQAAADAVAFLASSAGDGISGRLIAALWDDWRSLPELRQSLAGSDVYTLRRIVPEDRGWPRS